MSQPFYGRPMEILLIEDSQPDACATMKALKDGKIRHRLTLVADGEEALLFLKQQQHYARAPRPDLILLDLGLPRLNGRELLEQIRGDEELRAIPAVVMTSSSEHEELIREENLQVEDYITKPIDFASFIGLVRRLKTHWQTDVILPMME